MSLFCVSRYIYTDGSKSNDAVGCAFYSTEGTGSLRLQDHASIFSAESVALQMAISWAERSGHGRFLVMSDSLSCLLALDRFYNTDPRIAVLSDGVHQLLSKGKLISFLWVPSHVGIPGNEEADLLAKQSLQLIDRTGGIPHTDMKGVIGRCIREECQRTWSLLPNNKLKEVNPLLGPRPKSAHHGQTQNRALRPDSQTSPD